MKMYLIHQDLFDCVTGESSDVKKNSKALASIVLSIDPSLLYLVGPEPSSATEVWELLRKQFQKDTWLNRLSLKKRLYNIRLTDNDVNRHIREMTELFQSLSLLDCKVDDEEKVCLLLSSLPEKYDTLVTALGAAEKAPTFEQVTERLLADASRTSSTVKVQSEEVLTVRSKVKKTALKCFYCNKEGHFKNSCSLLKRDKKKNESKTPKVNSLLVQEGCLSGEYYQTDHCKWILDSGATSHMCCNRKLFSELLSHDDTNSFVSFGDGHRVISRGIGKVHLYLGKEKCILNDVIFVPELRYNLLSVSKLLKHGFSVTFSGNSGKIIENGKIFAFANFDFKENQFVLKCLPIKGMSNCTLNAVDGSDNDAGGRNTSDSKEVIWHYRYGHLGRDNLSKLSLKDMVRNFDFDHRKSLGSCEFCIKGKHNRSPFPTHDNNQGRNDILGLIHSDVCGPLPDSLGNNKYFVTFIDDTTRHCWAYPISAKDQVLSVFQEFKTMIEKITGKSIKILRSDNGGEYKSKDFGSFMVKCGIRHEFTVPKTPEQNGVAERLNRLLMEKVRTMLVQSKLPHSFWAEALNTAVHVHNISPSRVLGDNTPRELLTGRKPNVSYLKCFGCTAFVHIPKDQRKKLDPKSRKCIFIGYGQTSKGYRLYDFEKKGIILSRDVIFDESKFEGLRHKGNNSFETRDLFPLLDDTEFDEDKSVSGEEDLVAPPRRSTRENRPVDRLGDWIYHANYNSSCEIEPKTLAEALQRQDGKLWKEAVDSELNSLLKNHVWELTKLPKGRKAIGCKWVFKRKINPDGTIHKYKARLVAQGFSQIYGEDYDEVFAPVARFESIRAVVSEAVKEKMHIHQMDVTAAFLNGDLQEEIFMRQPEGYAEPGGEGLVCRLKKSLYGLKQSPKCWNDKIDSCLKDMRFKKTVDTCVYVRENGLGEKFIICLYVDDLILVNKDKDELVQVKDELIRNFDVKDLGELHHFLGVEFRRQENGNMWMGQQSFIHQTLTKFGMQNCSPTDTPVCNSQRLTPGNKDSERVDPQKYKSAVGSLLYLSTRTRPDIAYGVGLVARFASDPCKEHWVAVKIIFRYLKGTTNLGLLYSAGRPGDTETCVGFSDADWAGDTSDRKSTSGYIFLNVEGAVLWGSKKQTCVALSTAEAEYLALAQATQEATWLNSLLTQISLHKKETMVINEDNQSAICIVRGQEDPSILISSIILSRIKLHRER